MAWSDGIDGVHLEIAADPRSPLHVIGGPGTGKTKAIMHRVARMLEEDGDAERVLAVTFTRTAAKDLRRQLTELNVPGALNVKATTLHSLCFSILAGEAVFEATARRARPLLSHEMKQLVNDLRTVFAGKKKVKRLLKAHEAAYARLQHEEAGHPRTRGDIAFRTALLDWLRYHGSMLIGELVPLTLEFLRNNPQAEGVPTFDAVLADEYQDLNKAEQRLVDHFALQGSLTVIGDDNQSIYRFRHANPEGIRTFAATHPNTIPYVIEECKRCPPNIVRISNSLIGHDVDVRPNVLVPEEGRPDATLHVVQHNTVADEADAIAAFIDQYLTRRNGLSQGQVLVVSPNRLFGNAARDALNQRGRNAMSFFWEDQLSTPSAADGFCLLSLLVNRNDRAAYRAWIGAGRDDGYRVGYRRVRRYAEDNALEPMEVVRRISEEGLAISFTAGIVERHTLLHERLDAIGGLKGLDLVKALWPEIEDNRTVRQVASSLALDVLDPQDLLTGLTEAITRPELPDSDGDTIRVMSLYKSKGLTAELVVVVGCVSGAIPTFDRKAPQAEQDALLKEQRRLFYVAATRARDTLILSSIRKMPIADALLNGIEPKRIIRENGEKIAITSASPFLDEMGQHLPHAQRGVNWRAALAI
jgi:DNA helicase-2/ATP-dependent DNA helicase PcrA